jgi:hypothetical protein
MKVFFNELQRKTNLTVLQSSSLVISVILNHLKTAVQRVLIPTKNRKYEESFHAPAFLAFSLQSILLILISDHQKYMLSNKKLPNVQLWAAGTYTLHIHTHIHV